MMRDAKGWFDKLLTKLVSRKLTVWVAGTIFLCYGMITSDNWMALSLAYVGIQGFTDLAVSWKSAKRMEEDELDDY